MKRLEQLVISFLKSEFSEKYFYSDEQDAKEPIPSMPGVYRYGINHLRKMLQPLVLKGLQSILLFGVSKHLKKVTLIRKC